MLVNAKAEPTYISQLPPELVMTVFDFCPAQES